MKLKNLTRKNLTRLFLVALMVGLVSFGPAAIAVGTIVVKPTSMDGWNFQTGLVPSGTGTADGGFQVGPLTPPLGTGSVHFTTGTDGNSFAQIRNRDYDGTLLSAITALSYDTYVTAHGGCVAVYLSLVVDLNSNGVFDPGIDDRLFFEPCYQSNGYGTILPDGQTIALQNPPLDINGSPVRTGEWQHWVAFDINDLTMGGWWSDNDGFGGPPLTTLGNYINRDVAHQNARIINIDQCLGGVRLVAGGGAPVWDNFDGNADNLTIGISGVNTTYDYEFEAVPIPPCGAGDVDGCTLTIGFWKTHAGFTGRNPDLITPLLPVTLGSGGGKTITVTTATQAVSLLSLEGSNGVFSGSNGINKLYAQLLAAKLNIASGADGSSVSSTIAAADAFLVTKDSTDWTSLSKAQKKMVLGWVSILDSFNNGLIGPGHCDQL